MATTISKGLILKFILESGVAAPLSGSEESWAIIEEVYNKLQPYIEGNTGWFSIHFLLIILHT